MLLDLECNYRIAMYGKALKWIHNFSSCSKKIMDKALKSFTSSTFWTERVGFVAGLKTIK